MRIRAAAALAAALLATAAYPAIAEAPAAETRAAQFAQLPYWNGYWVSDHQQGTTIGGIAPEALEAREKGERLPADFMALGGFNAPWNEEGKARYAARVLASPGRKANGWGYPMMMNAAAPLQFLITPEEVLILNPYGDVRHVYTDGRDHPAEEDRWPTVWGDSIGHWEGDTLVIDTISVKDPSAYFHGSPPLSEQAHYTERMRMPGPDRIESQITIVDPVTLTGPWTAKLAYVRDEGFDRMIQIEYENDRTGFDGELNTIEPTAEAE